MKNSIATMGLVQRSATDSMSTSVSTFLSPAFQGSKNGRIPIQIGKGT